MSEWSEERIAALRRYIADLQAADLTGDTSRAADDARHRWQYTDGSPKSVLSLLDELESTRRERDEANEGLHVAYMLGATSAIRVGP